MHGSHSVQNMQPSQDPPRTLLTALEVQQLLHIDRSTVYRMAEDGRLPAIRVGRSWRFPAERIEALLDAGDGPEAAAPSLAVVPDHQGVTPVDVPVPTRSPAGDARPDASPVNSVAARATVEVASELLGVMMVVTDMHGRPLTPVAHPSPWFVAHADDPRTLDRCIAEWHHLADHPDLTPQFQRGTLGFECARAFIRHGSTLVGMVLAGGVSPARSPETDPDLYHLDDAERHRVLAALPRIAAAISASPRAGATPDPAPRSAAAAHEAPAGAAMKEN
jgi:excisionase family DNA binding protein